MSLSGQHAEERRFGGQGRPSYDAAGAMDDGAAGRPAARSARGRGGGEKRRHDAGALGGGRTLKFHLPGRPTTTDEPEVTSIATDPIWTMQLAAKRATLSAAA